jgi:NAD-dependent dihydropyrimidine dehydrogenase PreA subunit
MAVFIRVSLDERACDDNTLCEPLIGLCPVDIFKLTEGRVTVDDDQVDECTLCGLCWEKLPQVVKVEKLY